MTIVTRIVVSCTDAVNSGAETCCTGSETAKTGSVFGSEASSREVVAVGYLALAVLCWAACRRSYSFWYWPQCCPTIGEIDEGKFKEGARVNRAKVKGDVNKAAN